MNEETETHSADPLAEAAEQSNWKLVENLWLERIERDELTPEPLLEAARRLAEAGQKDRLKVLASMTAPGFLSAGREGALADLTAIAAQAGVEDTDLAEAYLAAIRRLHADHSAADTLVTRADLERGKGLRHLLSLEAAFFRFDRGDLVHHGGGWGFGEVEKLVPRREEIHVRFESGRSHVFPMRTVGGYLERIPPERIDAMIRRRPEALAEEAHADPLRVVERAADAHGGAVDGKTLKSLLVPAVIPESEWGGWWNGVRDKARFDPYFDITPGANPRIAKRSTPRSFSANTETAFDQAMTFWDKLKVLRGYARKVRRKDVDAAFVANAFERLRADAESPARRAALHFLCTHLKPLSPAMEEVPFPEDFRPEGLGAFVEKLDEPEYRLRLLETVRSRYPDVWMDVFENLLFVEYPKVLDAVVDALSEAGAVSRIEGRLPALLAAPGQMPRAYLWFFRAALGGRLAFLSSLPSATELLDRLLDVFHGAVTGRIAEGSDARDLQTRARGLFTTQAMEKAFGGVSEAVAKRLWTRIRTVGLSRNVVNRAERIVASAYPALIAEEKEREPQAQAQVIWTSPAGLKKRRKEYDVLINEEVPKNAEALGKAIAMGDLSENAEYDAAREEQGRLTERAKIMEEELRIARVIDPASVKPDEVCVGSVAEVETPAGERKTYTLLGPWDTDPERGKISYLSPIGQGLLGKKAGETASVRLPDGETALRVISTAPAPEIASAPPPPGA